MNACAGSRPPGYSLAGEPFQNSGCVRMLGSAAYHLLTMARGSSLVAVESTPKVWDLAGALLVAQEAGGLVEGLDGSPLFPLPPEALDYAAISRPVLAAANRGVLEEFRASISPIEG